MLVRGYLKRKSVQTKLWSIQLNLPGGSVVWVGDVVVVLDIVVVVVVDTVGDGVGIVAAVEDRQYITCQLSEEATTYIKQHNMEKN